MQRNPAIPRVKSRIIPEKWLKALGLNRKELRAWAMYDWANSAFVTTIIAAVLPIYFSDVAAANLPENERTAMWGYIATIALVIAAVLSPVLGALADQNAAKKKLLAAFLALGVFGSIGLVFVGRGDWMLAAVLFIIGNVGFAAGEVFYEALLPHIATTEEMDRVSTAGYALGYVGGGILLAINLLWIQQPQWFGMRDATQAVQLSFVSVGIWWFVFSIPLFRWVPEPPASSSKKHKNIFSALWDALIQLYHTLCSLAKFKQTLIFLAAFWLYSDGVGTIFKMAAIYGREVGIGSGHLIGALMLVQFLGIPFTFMFGAIANRIGVKQAVMVTLVVYMVICVFGFYMKTAQHFWLLAVGVASVQGGCQALSRSIFASIIPRDRSAEFFGFFSISSKFAGLLGPFAFGLAGQMFGNSRYSILLLIVFFVLGILILLPFDLEKGRGDARAAER